MSIDGTPSGFPHHGLLFDEDAELSNIHASLGRSSRLHELNIEMLQLQTEALFRQADLSREVLSLEVKASQGRLMDIDWSHWIAGGAYKKESQRTATDKAYVVNTVLKDLRAMDLKYGSQQLLPLPEAVVNVGHHSWSTQSIQEGKMNQTVGRYDANAVLVSKDYPNRSYVGSDFLYDMSQSTPNAQYSLTRREKTNTLTASQQVQRDENRTVGLVYLDDEQDVRVWDAMLKDRAIRGRPIITKQSISSSLFSDAVIRGSDVALVTIIPDPEAENAKQYQLYVIQPKKAPLAI